MHKTQTAITTAPKAPTEAHPAVAINGVTFGYVPSVTVIRSVTASLAPGKLTTLIGPNASGKSTLLKLILGQLTPDTGGVAITGRPVASLSYRQRASLVSYIPQRGLMSFAFTVRQVVAMGRYALGDDDRIINHALEACDLTQISHRIYAQLSGGQQQRVLLARALAQSAGAGRVMLLDEPASGMDLRHIHQTMRQLRTLAEGGLAVLVVLHDVNLAARYADDVWLMNEGELAAAGPCHEVMRPDVLSGVYGVRFLPIQPPAADPPAHGNENTDRPVFWIDPPIQ